MPKPSPKKRYYRQEALEWLVKTIENLHEIACALQSRIDLESITPAQRASAARRIRHLLPKLQKYQAYAPASYKARRQELLDSLQKMLTDLEMSS